MKNWKTVVSLFLLPAANALAGSLISSMPVGRVHPLPGGILYPGFNTAAGRNPAAIPLTGKGSALQLAATPAFQSSDSTDLFGSVATTRGSFGFGAGYLGSSYNSQLTNGFFAGMGYNFDPASVGIAVRDFDVRSGNTSVDVGFQFETKQEITLGAVLYDVNNTSRAAIGVGTKSGKRYNLEANVLLPPFNNMDGGYVGTLSASIFPGMIGFHFSTSYYTAAKSWDYVVGVGVFASDMIHIALQYATTRRATAAVTFIF